MLEPAMTRRKKPELPPDIVIGEADNPYTHDGAQRRIQVAYSTRDDPLRGMRSRNQIDEAQFQAGRLWQKYREQSEVGGIRAIDTTKEPVDGGGSYPEPISDVQRKAVLALNAARVELDKADITLIDLVESVLWRGSSIVRIAASYGFVSNRGIEFLARRFRMALEILAKMWGFAGR